MTIKASPKETPILFSGPMVRAIMEDRKTQTRRVAKLNAAGRVFKGKKNWHVEDPEAILACPHGVAGDRLWVRETFVARSENNVLYRADDGYPDPITPLKWYPSIFMPRWASRLTLELVKVRLERLQNISEEDAMAEGIHILPVDRMITLPRKWPKEIYRELWESINGKRYPWSSNPLVWVEEFRRIK